MPTELYQREEGRSRPGCSDVVDPGPADLGFAPGDVRDRRAAEDVAQRLDALGPDATRLARLLADLAVQRLDDLDDADLIGLPGEPVAALDASLADEQAVA